MDDNIPRAVNDENWHNAFEEGREAFQNQLGLASNPYQDLGAEEKWLTLRDAFKAGWQHEQSMQ